MRRLGDVLELIYSSRGRFRSARAGERTQDTVWRLWWAGDAYFRFESDREGGGYINVRAGPTWWVQAVHNLEHGYVLIYYRQDGDGALSGRIVRDLEDLANTETKVLLAPYPELPEQKCLAFVAWTKLQTCPQVTDGGDTLKAAKGFVQRFRGGGDAPEQGAV